MPFKSMLPCFALAGALFATTAAQAVTRYVAPCGNDAWAGVNVNCVAPLGPKRTIQAAINASSPSDTVMVMPGVYFETIDFNGKEITVHGAAGPATTIIDGNGDGPVVLCNSFEGAGTTLSGLTIRNGFTENLDGGGMLVALATVTIENCIFEANVADVPAYCGGLAANLSNLTVSGCEFRDNWGWFAGGMFVQGGTATITDCLFDGNNGYNAGGGIYAYQTDLEIGDSDFMQNTLEGDGFGAAMFIDENSTVSMSGCSIANHTPAGGTSGIHIEDDSTLSLVNCDFTGNINASQFDPGGAIHASTSTVQMLGCQFSDNQSPGHAGAVYGGDSSITAAWCGFLNNHADWDGGAIVVSGMSSLTASLCTFTGNSSDQWRGGAIAAFYQAPIVLQGCTFSNNVIGPIGKGGGLFQMGGSLLASSCTFNNNSGPEGGAVNLFDLDGDARFVNCSFTGNDALNGDGGAIRVVNVRLEIEGGDFQNNQATGRGGAVCTIHDAGETSVDVHNADFTGNSAVLGGGALCANAPTTIVGSGFFNNTADNAGGLALIGPFGNARIHSSRFDGNTATQAGSAIMVGAFSPGGGAEMVNCIVSENIAGFGDGAIHESVLGANLRIANCAIVDNQGGGLVIENGATQSIVSNTVFWGNNNGLAIGGSQQPLVRFSNVQGGFVGVGNINANPLFVNAAVGNYAPAAGSPCIDAGATWALPIDALDLDGDADTLELVPLDYNGAPRISDNPATAGAACGGLARVDIGPIESLGEALEDLHPGDANGDGVVDVNDLLAVITTWGPCPSACCAADFDVNGTIDVNDLLTVIVNWG